MAASDNSLNAELLSVRNKLKGDVASLKDFDASLDKKITAVSDTLASHDSESSRKI
jgi:hypothetical protein